MLLVLIDVEDEVLAYIDNKNDFSEKVANEMAFKECKSQYIYSISLDSTFQEFRKKLSSFINPDFPYFIPYPSEIIEDFLYLGGCYNGNSLEQLKNLDIKLTINTSTTGALLPVSKTQMTIHSSKELLMEEGFVKQLHIPVELKKFFSTTMEMEKTEIWKTCISASLKEICIIIIIIYIDLSIDDFS